MIAGRYALLEEIGRGGMGIVWLADDRTIGRRVAIKQLHVPAGVAPEERGVFEARVLREARAAGRLNDPGIVTVYDVLQEDGDTYIVMELIEAPTLSALVAREGPQPETAVRQLAEQLLAALETAHAAGVVHRDVKPSNIMVLPNGRVKLTDFGIAQSAGETRLTMSGALIGSPGYMAPERLRGDETDARSDLWALGAVLFYAVEGNSPFERPTAAATIQAVLNERPRLTRCHGRLASVITGLLDTSPAARPTADDVRAKLATATHEPPTRIQTADRSSRTATKVAWRIAAVVVLVVAIVAGAILLWNADDGKVAGSSRPPSDANENANQPPTTATEPPSSAARPQNGEDLKRDIFSQCANEGEEVDTRHLGPLVRYDTESVWVVAPIAGGKQVFDCTQDGSGVFAVTLHDVPPPNGEEVQWISRTQIDDHEIYYGRVSPNVVRIEATHPDFPTSAEVEIAGGLYAYDWPDEGALNVTLTAYDKQGAKIYEGNCCLK
jgi:serine/threonine protein kinase